MTEHALEITPLPTGVRLGLRVVPRARRTTIAGVRGGRLLVRVTAPPVDHAATEAALVAVAHALGVPARSVRLVAGATTRNKTVEITGLSADEVRRRFSP